jgi:membrane-bound transcription factor site-1 protease
MSTWSLLDGFGIIKPDILTYGTNIMGLSMSQNQCESSSGTSISCAIISASTALALS